jgi:hypothetical protein
VHSSVYRGEAAADEQLAHSAARLRQLWERLQSSPDDAFIEGRY